GSSSKTRVRTATGDFNFVSSVRRVVRRTTDADAIQKAREVPWDGGKRFGSCACRKPHETSQMRSSRPMKPGERGDTKTTPQAGKISGVRPAAKVFNRDYFFHAISGRTL